MTDLRLRQLALPMHSNNRLKVRLGSQHGLLSGGRTSGGGLWMNERTGTRSQKEDTTGRSERGSSGPTWRLAMKALAAACCWLGF